MSPSADYASQEQGPDLLCLFLSLASGIVPAIFDVEYMCLQGRRKVKKEGEKEGKGGGCFAFLPRFQSLWDYNLFVFEFIATTNLIQFSNDFI